MGDTGAAVPSPWWLLVAALALAAAGAVTASGHAAVVAHREGRTIASGAGDPFREVARLLRQRPRRTVAADLLLWRVATSGFVPVALLMVALVPLGAHVLVATRVGVVWFNAFDVAVWALVWLAGWGPNSTFGLVAGYRFLALALGYELPLMFALVAPAIAAGSLDPAVIAASQDGLWYAVWMPVALVAYCVGVLGFSVSGPMSSAAGRDLAGGVLAELSGVDRLLVLAGRTSLLVAGAAFAVPLFLGGGAGPWLPAWAWVVVKTLLLTAALVAAGERLPVLRPDKVLEVGWVVLLPLVVLQDLVVAVVAVSAA